MQFSLHCLQKFNMGIKKRQIRCGSIEKVAIVDNFFRMKFCATFLTLGFFYTHNDFLPKKFSANICTFSKPCSLFPLGLNPGLLVHLVLPRDLLKCPPPSHFLSFSHRVTKTHLYQTLFVFLSRFVRFSLQSLHEFNMGIKTFVRISNPREKVAIVKKFFRMTFFSTL